MKIKQNPFRFIPKVWTAVVYLILLAGSFYLFYGRKKTSFRIKYLEELFTDFYTHISNFTILFLLCMVIGYIWLMIGISFRKIVLLAIILIVINFIYELFIPIINTPDIVDAYYGTAGAIPALVFLYLASRFGLKPNKMKSN